MTQRVILIHGPPACGKLTTARALQQRIGGVILHNHMTYNLAHTLFEIGDPRGIELHRALRRVMLDYALREDMPDLILTLVYAKPHSEENVADIVRLAASRGAALLPVYLKCPQRELFIRVTAKDRIASGKLSSPERLRDLLSTRSHPPLPHPATRIIDNGDRSADDVAAEIAGCLAELPGSAVDTDPASQATRGRVRDGSGS